MATEQYSAYDEYINGECDFSKIESIYEIPPLFLSLSQNEVTEELKAYSTWDYELFLCCEIDASQRKEGQSFLYPKWTGEDGVCVPNIDYFENERLDFYKSRLCSSTEPLLRLRYSNYLLEKLPQGRERFELARNFSNELLHYISQRHPSLGICNDFSRLIEISLMYNVEHILSHLDPVIKAYIEELRFVDKTSLGKDVILLCLFQKLRFFKNKLWEFISQPTIDQLFSAMLDYRNYYSSNDIQLAVSFQRELIELYQIIQKDIKPLAKELGSFYERQAKLSDSLISVLGSLEMALATYLRYGISDEIDRIKVVIKETIRKLSGSEEMKEHFIPLNPQIFDSINAQAQLYIDTIFNDEIEDCVRKLASNIFIPDHEKIKVQSKEEAQNAIFTQFVTINAISNGRSIFIGNDLNDHELYFYIQAYNLELILYFDIFNKVWEKLINDGMSVNIIMPLFEAKVYLANDQMNIIQRGIERFLENDFISALHILTPQFENAFRRLFESKGYATTNVSSDITQKEQTFTSFLENDFVKILPADYLYLVDFVMVNKLGFNLRNEIAHGLIETRLITKTTSQIVLYLFIVLMGFKLEVIDE